MDEFEDKRLNKKQSRVSLDGNAGFQAAVAAIHHLKINKLLGNTASRIMAPSGFGIILNLLLVFAILFCKV